MVKAKRFFRIALDIIELWLPTLLLLTLFVVFVLGVFFRYVMRNPQSWTYELSSISYLSFVILSACYVQRTEKHIVFDLFFNRMTAKVQCIMRIISNLIVTITCVLLTPASINYVLSMKNLTSQILKIPRGLIFICFVLLFFSTTIRAGIRTVLDCKSFIGGSYECNYAISEEVDE